MRETRYAFAGATYTNQGGETKNKGSPYCDPIVILQAFDPPTCFLGPAGRRRGSTIVNTQDRPAVPFGTPARRRLQGVRWPIDKHAGPVFQGLRANQRLLSGAARPWS